MPVIHKEAIMQKNIISCILAMLSIVSSLSVAAPLTCVPVKVKVVNHNLILEGASLAAPAGQLYFFKNNSQKSLWVDHYGKQSAASAGWASYIRTHNWSALFLNKKEFTLSCAVIQPGKVDYVNCGQALSVCVPAHPALPSNRKGSYWLVEDKPWDVFLTLLARRGVK
jgi:hypothetical protein